VSCAITRQPFPRGGCHTAQGSGAKGSVGVKSAMKTILKASALHAKDKHRRRSSHAHPRFVQQERESSPERSSQSGSDREEEDPAGSSGGESDDSEIKPGGVKAFFDFEAGASSDGGRSSGSEGSAVFNEVIDKDAAEEKELLLSPSHPLHEIGSAEIKKKSEWAGKVLLVLCRSCMRLTPGQREVCPRINWRVLRSFGPSSQELPHCRRISRGWLSRSTTRSRG
jgi:hypothetical protein